MKTTALCLTLLALLVTGAIAAPPADPLNVLFIAVDDLRPELGCYDHPAIKSPNIDRLAAEGLLFRQAYCQQAVCAPSRASLMSGLRPDSTTIYDLNHPLRETLPDVLTMPEHFRKHGYTALSLGKIYHHYNDDNGRGWSEPAWHPQGDWKGRGYLAPASFRAMETMKPNPKGMGPAFEGPEVEDAAYPDGRTAAEAIRALQRLKKDGNPFFLAVGFLKPHLPFNAPKRYWDLYDEAAIRVPAQRDWPEGMPPLAGSSWGELRNYIGMPAKGPVSDETARQLIRGYYACVSYTDANVGRVIGELERLGLRERTVVILWGDHGWKLGDYGAWCKHTNLERDTHVPMILSAPGRAARGKATDALVEFVDIFPTLADVCGLPVPAACEGASMVPLLDDPARAWKTAAFSQYPRGKIMGYSVRSGRYRYTEWIDRKTGQVTARELYDHAQSDTAPANLADRPERAGDVRRLSALLAKGQGWKAVRAELKTGR